MTAAPLRVAIAGLGFGEKVHLPALRDCPATEPVALWHPRAERLEQACRAHDLPGHTEFTALLAEPGIDAVVIATPPQPRPELARAALEAGKALLLEKPVAPQTEAIEELQRLALGRNLVVGVDFEYRAVPVFQQLAAHLEQGVLGTPWLVKFDWLMSSRADASRPWTWYSSAAAGGGVLGALGTHAFDILQWLIGPGRNVRGRLSTAIRERPTDHGSLRTVDADDVALIHLELEDRQGRAVPCQLSLSSVARHGRGCWIELHGSDATLVLGSDNQADYVHGFQLWMAKPGEPLRPVPVDPALAFPRTWGDGRIAPVRRLMGWWAEAVRQGQPMVPGLAEAVASQRLCDAARATAEADSTGPAGDGAA
jgi:predicted dehydrogenase